MKTVTQLLSVSLFAFCSLFLGSCKKDSIEASGNQELTAGRCEVRFNYSGAQSGSFQSVLASTTATSGGGFAQIACSVVSGLSVKAVQIGFPTSIAVGTTTQVSAGADLANGFLMTYAIDGSGWVIGGGTASGFSVTVTKNTGTEMEGTFSGELGSDSDATKVTLTGGYFHCKL